MGERNALLDVALQALDGSLQERLLLLGDVTKDIKGLLGAVGLQSRLAWFPGWHGVPEGSTYSELDGDREEVNASLLGNLLSAGNTGKVDEAGLDEALGTLDSLEDLLGEARNGVSVRRQQRQGCSSIAVRAHTGSRRRPWRELQSLHRPWP